MANQYPSKIVTADGRVWLDLTGDTVSKSNLLTGATAHGKDGAPIVGECSYDSDTSDATMSADELLEGEVAYARGARIVGTLPNVGAQNSSISTKNGVVNIEHGVHDGSGKVGIADAEKSKIIAGNIKSGVTILGVTGDYGGETVTAQAKTVTPSFSSQKILPDPGVDYLSEVTVNAIPVSITDNSAGGQTVTIG